MPSSDFDPDTAPAEAGEEITDPEAAPALPAAALARTAAAGTAEAPARVHDSYREIWSLSWPVILAQVLANGVSLIDIAMVGRLGSGSVAAAGYANQFFWLAQSALFAVGAACVALMARAIGAADPARARRALAASIEAAGVTALVVTVAVLAAPGALLRLLGAEASIIELTIPYLNLLLGSSLLLSLSMTIESGMRADRDTRTPMLVALGVTLVKIALNFVLIFGALGFPRMGLVGAGVATVVSQIAGVAVLGWIVARRRSDSLLALRWRDFREAGALRRQVVRIALPGVGERLVMNLAILAYFRVLSEYGPVAIAAYTVGIRLMGFSWMPGVGFGTATATLVGQALGAGDAKAATAVGWRATRLALFVAVTLGAIFGVAREPLARLFTNDLELVAALGPFLLCLAVAQPFLQTHFTLGGAHRGAGDTWTPLVAASVGNWALRVPLAYGVAFALAGDVIWVWGAIVLDHLARSVWLAASFRRGRWRDTLQPSPSRPGS
jgi:putative MATE family efflux protein